MNTTLSTASPSYAVRFVSICGPGGSAAFPCDGQGRVELDALSESGRKNYLFARSLVSQEIAVPRIYRVTAAAATVPH